MKIACALVCLLLAAASAEAQAPFPGAVNVNGDWVPCDHPIAVAAGRSCTAPTPHVAPGLIDCSRVNGYTHPLDALTCALNALPEPPMPLPAFQVGRQYVGPYPSQRMVAIGISRSIDGVEVVTFQMTETAHVGACRNDGGPANTSCSAWRPHLP